MLSANFEGKNPGDFHIFYSDAMRFNDFSLLQWDLTRGLMRSCFTIFALFTTFLLPNARQRFGLLLCNEVEFFLSIRSVVILEGWVSPFAV